MIIDGFVVASFVGFIIFIVGLIELFQIIYKYQNNIIDFLQKFYYNNINKKGKKKYEKRSRN